MAENPQNPAPPNLRVRADDVVNRLETVLEGLRVIVGHVHGAPPALPQPATPLAPPQPTPLSHRNRHRQFRPAFQVLTTHLIAS